LERLTTQEIEDIAQRVYRAYCRLPQNQGATVTRVDPELLATELLKLNIEYHYLSITGAILGVTAKNNYKVTVFDSGSEGEPVILWKNTVFLDSYLKSEECVVGRHNFTLMHEACHHILWKLFPSQQDPAAASRLYYCYATQKAVTGEERITNALASAILMPPALVLRKMQEFGLGIRIALLNRIYDPRGYQRFSDMADSLGVSKTALCIRLQKLMLLDEAYLRDPYALFDLVPDESYSNVF